MSNNETPRQNHDNIHMVHRLDHHHPLGDILRPGGDLQRCPRRPTLHRSLARFPERSPLLSDRQHGILLHPTHDSHHHVLRPDLDQGLEEEHPDGHKGCADGTDATEVEGQSC